MLSLKKRQRLRRYMSIFLAAAMVTAFTPAEVFTVTAEDISYPAALAADNEVSGGGHADQAATDEASVTIDGATLYYATLEEAFSAANGKTAVITMLNDAECIKDSSGGSPLSITGGSVTLDMNGKTLSGSGYGYYGIVNVSSGSLLVQGEGTIKVAYIGLSCWGGKLTVANTNFELIGHGSLRSNAAIYNHGGTIIINGGKITGSGYYGQIHQYSGNITINNVTATGSDTAYPDSLQYYNEGTLKINGGTFDKISVKSGNSGGVQSVAELLGNGCTYRHTDKTWTTANELAAMQISNVTVEKIPLTIAPEAETSWYYNSAEHSLKMNAVPTTAGNEITYEWYNGDTKLDCTSDAYTIPKTMSAGSYTYTCKATCDGYTLSNEFTFEIKQSGTSIDNIKTYNGDTETDQFSAGDTITVKAEPTATGTAPKKAAARLRADPTAGQMALFIGDTQVSEPVNADGNGVYTMTVGASDVLLQGNKEPNTAVTLTAKFVGNDNMADAAGTVNVTVSAAAKAEKGGNIIGYLDAAAFEGTNSVFMQNAYAGSTITLLSDVQPDTSSESGKTCSTMVNISCTLDLNGYDLSSSGIAVYVLPNGVLTVQDSSVSKTGRVISTADAAVENNGRLTLKDGTYSGTPAIKTAGELSGILPNDGGSYYAFYRDGKPVNITEQENKKELTGTVTVKLCAHDGVTPASNNNGTHTLNCPYCGSSGTAENCTYSGEYTTDETNHTQTCTVCGYENIEAHTITLTSTADSNNNITLNEACGICGYKKELGTVTVTIPELTYGETEKTVNFTGIPENCMVICQADGGSEFQSSDGDTEMSITLGRLFGNNKMTVGEHKLNLTLINADNKYSNECELTFTVKECPHIFERQSDESSHWHECTLCGDKTGIAAHTPDSGTVTVRPTADSTGIRIYACTECGKKIREETIPAIDPDHEHAYGTDWSYNRENHWHECSCGETSDMSAHIWDSGVPVTAPTCTEAGVMTYSCTVCGITKTEPVNALGHSFTNYIYNNDATCTADGTETAVCGRCSETSTRTAVGSKKEHTEDGGTVTKQPTETEAGVRTFYCTVCGREVRTETIPAIIPEHTHVFGTTWNYDSTSHWHECTCGERSDTASHISDSGTVTKQPTAAETGVRTYKCTVCGYVMNTETIPAAGTPSAPNIPSPPSDPSAPSNPTASETAGKEPFIQGDNGKTGWDAISDIISGTPDGGTVTVDMNNTSLLPKDIISQIKGRNIDLVLDMGRGFIWKINGTGITKAKTVNMRIRRASKIPASAADEYFGGLETVQIQLDHNGDLGFTAELTVDLGSIYNGMYASSYCYKARRFTFGDKAEISDGKAKLKFDHASNWLIVITDCGDFEDVSSDAGITAEGDDVECSNIAYPCLLTVILTLAAAVVCFKRSKQK